MTGDHNQPAQGPAPSATIATAPTKPLFGDLMKKAPARRDVTQLVALMAPTLLQGSFDSPLKFDNPAIPAGYTYLGQFITHEIATPTLAMLAGKADPKELRSCGLDLDSLYGGPTMRPELFDGARLRIGKGKSGGGDVSVASLPRDANGGALIGDARNDENLLTAQLHSAFIDFHNRMVDYCHNEGYRDTDKDKALLERTKSMVRKHFQWIVLWDFLPRICGGAAFIRDMVGTPGEASWGEKPRLRFYQLDEPAYVPTEFWTAVFRFGHSMARPSYFLNDTLSGPDELPANRPYHHRIPLFDPKHGLGDLFRVGDIPGQWTVQWKYFFSFDEALRPWDPGAESAVGFALEPKPGPQPSLLIDEELISALAFIPNKSGKPESLIFQDLTRGEDAGLPSGQLIAEAIGCRPLTPEQIGPLDLEPASLLTDTPLLYYVLREAAVLQGGRCLGPVGRTIIAETLIGLLWHSQDSILKTPRWRPTPGDAVSGQPYTMAHFLHFAYSHHKTRLPYRPAPPWPSGAPEIV